MLPSFLLGGKYEIITNGGHDMELILYKTQDSENVIGKEKELIYRFDMVIKNDVDIVRPVLILNDKGTMDFKNCNYAFIEELGRYYFIRSVDNINKNIWGLNLECDVLDTYKDDILNSYATYERNIQEGDYGQVNDNSEVRKETDLFMSDVTLVSKKEVILTTIGG